MKKIKNILFYIAIPLIIFIIIIYCSINNENTNPAAFNKINEVVFSADFSGSSPSNKQFYSWEGREYEGKLY